MHRVRQGLVSERTALINQLRGLLSEFGIVIPKGRYPAQREIPLTLEDANNGLPMLARQMIGNLWARIKIANEQILFYDRELHRQAHHHDIAKRLLTIPGVGEQVASGVVTNVTDPMLFKNSRQFAAWVRLVPRQYTTGGNIQLGRITKQGDSYLRTCLVHGARQSQRKT